jgi:hypothetical protein
MKSPFITTSLFHLIFISLVFDVLSFIVVIQETFKDVQVGAQYGTLLS